MRLLVLAVFLLSSCTYTRGPCTVLKENKVTFVCEQDGRAVYLQPFTP